MTAAYKSLGFSVLRSIEQDSGQVLMPDEPVPACALSFAAQRAFRNVGYPSADCRPPAIKL